MDTSRNEILIGSDGQQKLARAAVTIVGTGGVGGAVALLLCRAGVGRFRLIDFDKVSPSNINRQVVAFPETIGENKVDVLKKIINKINPDAKVDAICQRVCGDNLHNLFEGGSSEIVIDAIDSVSDKLELIVFCKQSGKYIISAMGAGNRFDIPNFQLTDIFKTHDDGLAKIVRKKLREKGIQSLDVVTSFSKPIKSQGVVGSISYYPVACATVLAAAVVNRIISN